MAADGALTARSRASAMAPLFLLARLLVHLILIALALHDCGSIGVAIEHAIGALGEERR